MLTRKEERLRVKLLKITENEKYSNLEYIKKKFSPGVLQMIQSDIHRDWWELHGFKKI